MEDALIQFIKFCQDNYNKPAYLGMLPAIMYMAEVKSAEEPQCKI